MKLRTNNVEFDYEIIGDGIPLISLHGYYLDRHSIMSCLEPAMNQQVKRIYFDLPYMGRTKVLTDINNSDDVLQEVLEFIDKIIPNQNFLVAGFSYGGQLTRGLIEKRRENILGALLISPVIITEKEKRNLPEFVIHQKDDKLILDLQGEETYDFFSQIVQQNRDVWNSYKNEMISAIKVAQDKQLQIIEQSAYGFTFPLREIQRPFAKPVTFILGRNDNVVGFQDALNLTSGYPKGTFAVLALAGHNLQYEQPDCCNAIISNWLRQCLG